MITFLSKPNSDLFRFSAALDGREFFFTCKRLRRSDRWHVDIRNSDGQVVAAGLRIVHDINMLEGRVGSEVPPGELSATNIERQDQPVTLANLAVTSFLGYFESIDIERLDTFIEATTPVRASIA